MRIHIASLGLAWLCGIAAGWLGSSSNDVIMPSRAQRAQPAGSAQLQGPTGGAGGRSGAASVLPLPSRPLGEWNLAPFLLLSTVDGELQARDRKTGEILWTLSEPPLVQIQVEPGDYSKDRTDPDCQESEDDGTVWLADPSDDGSLLYFSGDGGVERIPASVRQLIEHAPFGLVDNVVYTGTRSTTLYAVNATSGHVLHAYGAAPWRGNTGPPRGAPPPDVLLVGRTEYTLDIHESSTVSSRGGDKERQSDQADEDQDQYQGSGQSKEQGQRRNNLREPRNGQDQSRKQQNQQHQHAHNTATASHSGRHWRLTLAHWGPNSRDSDLQSQYTRPKDALYVTPLTNTTVMAMADNDMRPQRWVGGTPALAVRVLDVLTPANRPGSQYALVVQPPLKLAAMNSRAWDLYVDRAPGGQGYVAVGGNDFGVLVASNPNADFCKRGSGGSVLGVHPAWCQGMSPARQTSAPSMLPAASASGLPLLDPAPILDGQTPGGIASLSPGASWTHFMLRVGENLVTGLLMFTVAYLAAIRGWIPGLADGLALLAARLRPNTQKEASDQMITDKHSRKRGQRGGKKAREARQRQMQHQQHQHQPSVQSDAQEDGGLTGLVVGDEVLGYGSHGTVVLRGAFENRDVAVKRMLLSFYDIASQEVAILSESDDHPNVVRYYCKQETGQFLYIALELCPGTLEELVRGSPKLSSLRTALDADPRDALQQITLGLQHLHSLQLVHRDIKPQNILVAPVRQNGGGKGVGGMRLLISDFGLCRRLEAEQSSFQPTALTSNTGAVAGTAGWAAPEIALNSRRLTRKIDIFALGCLYYYVLCNGRHPFGENNMRQANIERDHRSLADLKTEEARDLVGQMISAEPRNRPDTAVILSHPFYWTDREKLDFLVKVSDRLEHDSREEYSPLLARLEQHAPQAVGSDWHMRFPREFVENLGKYRRYHGDRILDLLRALRNKLHHYNDFSPEMQALVGALPSGYLEFFTQRFPLLFMTVYRFSRQEFAGEDVFQDYFPT